MELNYNIVNAMAELNEEMLLSEVKKALKTGENPDIILSSLQTGMTHVGEMFSKREYFISELMLSANLFNECEALLPVDKSSEPKNGVFVIGTVYTDIHDIGKNIVIAIMRSNGFEVVDLGVDAHPEAFIEAIEKYDPKVIGMSCLLTTAYDAMKDCVGSIRNAGVDSGRLILVGGGSIDDSVCKYVDADDFCMTAQEGVNKALKFVLHQ